MPWSKLVTLIQLVQMVIGLIVTYHSLQCTVRADVVAWRVFDSLYRVHVQTASPLYLYWAVGMYVSYFLLFAALYVKKYITGKKKRWVRLTKAVLC